MGVLILTEVKKGVKSAIGEINWLNNFGEEASQGAGLTEQAEGLKGQFSGFFC